MGPEAGEFFKLAHAEVALLSKWHHTAHVLPTGPDPSSLECWSYVQIPGFFPLSTEKGSLDFIVF